ncbi:hypothetical protein ACH9L7_16835 (plasmid) [Haloferax sp. S1W]|uniref:hypothetical protein n=1 Tax=Haloferax sp. S1W TaxID=3377110 RepID=UPI0037C54BA3
MSSRRVDEAADAAGLLTTATSKVGDEFGVPVRTLAGLFGLLPVAVTTLYHVAHNTPDGLPSGVPEFVALWYPFAIVGPATAAFLLATDAEATEERVGLTFLGGFGLIALASPNAWIPAVIGTTVGGSVVVWSRLSRLHRDGEWDALRGVAPTALLIGGAALSLAATAGVASTTLRPLGSGVALLALGMTPALTGWDRTSLFVGAGAGLLTLGFATSTPYVAGAVLLVGGGVVGAPLGLVVLAVGGGVAGLVSGLRNGRADLALGAALLLAAGVPATLLRAAGVLVAVALFATASRGETV